jgi:hypothetical protein
MISRCDDRDFETIWSIANEAAQASILNCAGRQRNLDECQIPGSLVDDHLSLSETP